MSALTVPAHDRAGFAREKAACRDAVLSRLSSMTRLMSCGRGIGKAIAAEAARVGLAPATLRGYYDLFRKSGDWRVLVDRRKFPAPEKRVVLARSVIELWRTLCERNQRKCRPAYRELIRIWRADVAGASASPASDDWPEIDPLTDLPRGCTYRNLLRHASTPIELRLARVGRSAASAMLPKVLTTRIGIDVGQVYVCDDQDYDVSVAFVGINRKYTRPSGYNALDLASAAEILQGYKPTILNADGSKQKLRQVDFEWFLVNLLTNIGYRADTGTIIIREHGGAGWSEDNKRGKAFEERVALATGSKVKFDASGIHGEQLAGMFRGQPRGNPRYKATRESWFNLLRNEMAALPAPTGMDRHHAPEENYGLEKYVRDWLDVIAARPDLAEAVILPVMRWHQFVQATGLIVGRINARTEHELEGWADRVTSDWRLSTSHPWLPFSQYFSLPAPQRDVVDKLIQQTPGLWRNRKLAPWEVWEADRAKLTRVEGAMVPVLLGPDGGRAATVRDDHHITIEDAEIDPEPMWFDAALTNERVLKQKQKLLVYLNPFDASELQVCDPDGRFLGTAPRVHRICKLDAPALARRFGEVRKIESQLAAPVARRGAQLARERLNLREHNLSLLRDAAHVASRLPEECDAARAMKPDPASAEDDADTLADQLNNLL